MQTYIPKRSFTATNVKSICLLANSRQADLIGSKIMQNLRRVSNDQVTFHGYGGDWMKKEGFEPTMDFDIDLLQDKQFHTYRKTKTANETLYFKWNPLNLVNKGYVRKTDDAFENVSAAAAAKIIISIPRSQSADLTCLYLFLSDDECGAPEKNLLEQARLDFKYRQRVYDIPPHGRNLK